MITRDNLCTDDLIQFLEEKVEEEIEIPNIQEFLDSQLNKLVIVQVKDTGMHYVGELEHVYTYDPIRVKLKNIREFKAKYSIEYDNHQSYNNNYIPHPPRPDGIYMNVSPVINTYGLFNGNGAHINLNVKYLAACPDRLTIAIGAYEETNEHIDCTRLFIWKDDPKDRCKVFIRMVDTLHNMPIYLVGRDEIKNID